MSRHDAIAEAIVYTGLSAPGPTSGILGRGETARIPTACSHIIARGGLLVYDPRGALTPVSMQLYEEHSIIFPLCDSSRVGSAHDVSAVELPIIGKGGNAIVMIVTWMCGSMPQPEWHTGVMRLTVYDSEAEYTKQRNILCMVESARITEGSENLFVAHYYTQILERAPPHKVWNMRGETPDVVTTPHIVTTDGAPANTLRDDPATMRLMMMSSGVMQRTAMRGGAADTPGAHATGGSGATATTGGHCAGDQCAELYTPRSPGSWDGLYAYLGINQIHRVRRVYANHLKQQHPVYLTAHILEYCQGGKMTNIALCYNERRFDWDRLRQVIANSVIVQLFCAIQALHLKGYAHCDIHPDNVLISGISKGHVPTKEYMRTMQQRYGGRAPGIIQKPVEGDNVDTEKNYCIRLMSGIPDQVTTPPPVWMVPFHAGSSGWRRSKEWMRIFSNLVTVADFGSLYEISSWSWANTTRSTPMMHYASMPPEMLYYEPRTDAFPPLPLSADLWAIGQVIAHMITGAHGQLNVPFMWVPPIVLSRLDDMEGAHKKNDPDAEVRVYEDSDDSDCEGGAAAASVPHSVPISETTVRMDFDDKGGWALWGSCIWCYANSDPVRDYIKRMGFTIAPKIKHVPPPIFFACIVYELYVTHAHEVDMHRARGGSVFRLSARESATYSIKAIVAWGIILATGYDRCARHVPAESADVRHTSAWRAIQRAHRILFGSHADRVRMMQEMDALVVSGADAHLEGIRSPDKIADVRAYFTSLTFAMEVMRAELRATTIDELALSIMGRGWIETTPTTHSILGKDGYELLAQLLHPNSKLRVGRTQQARAFATSCAFMTPITRAGAMDGTVGEDGMPTEPPIVDIYKAQVQTIYEHLREEQQLQPLLFMLRTMPYFHMARESGGIALWRHLHDMP